MMAKLPQYKLKTKWVTAWLCRDMNGGCGVWLGRRKDVYMYNKAWEHVVDSDGRWCEFPDEVFRYSPLLTAAYRISPLLNAFDMLAAALPAPGECKRVRIEIPKYVI